MTGNPRSAAAVDRPAQESKDWVPRSVDRFGAPGSDIAWLYEHLKEAQESLARANVQSLRYAQDLKDTYIRSKSQEQQIQQANRLLLSYAGDLSTTVIELRQANARLETAYIDTIHRLATAAEYKDKDTGSHIARTSTFSAMLAEWAGLPEPDVRTIRYASPMHDVGKIGIPDHILLKPGKLTADEYEIVKTHPTIGSRILAGSTAAPLKMAEEIARCHHERWDGKGYPQGLAGIDIPQCARIVALVDVYDALTSVRPYKAAMPVVQAADIVAAGCGSWFDPALVDLFLGHLGSIASTDRCLTWRPTAQEHCGSPPAQS